ncbi:MAG: flagellar hook-basal body complex protein, partial [Candidatus Adiutrix sp.]|nr:flagellar hook-basal body complex protein [Candidatus Adiutrix sp.]
TIGGTYTGPGRINPTTGTLVSAPRTYDITYGWQDPATGQWRSANTSLNPPTLGFTWRDDLGNSGFVAVDARYILPGYDPPVEWTSSGLPTSSAYVAVIGYPGPYTLGNDGLTLTFNLDPNKPQGFGRPGQDAARVTAHSEQLGWAADASNAAGYFTVDAKFRNAPAAQSIELDMGARRTGGAWRLDGVGTTLYGGGSLTVDSRQDGYPQGGLDHLYVTEDGYITGVYSNKQEVALYQICITRFLNPWGLQKMGNNLFAVTRHSGPGVTTAPGEGGAAVVLGNFLEQSNVDTATEIVNMIMTQRGFQANSKVVTTHDAMISTAIETKR